LPNDARERTTPAVEPRVPVADGDLLLGRWQGIMLVELDGPRRNRRIAVTLIPAP
jgi:thiamine phosphate synthase YjbQ (UPF0047 family)